MKGDKPRVTVVSHALAARIGLDESIALAQLRFLVNISKHERDGKRWTYQSLDDLQKQLPFWNRSKIYRIIAQLAKAGYITIGNYNKHSYDRTSWYAITPEGESMFQNEICIFQNGEMHFSNPENAFSASETTIPEVTTEITAEHTHGAPPIAKRPVPSSTNVLIGAYINEFGLMLNNAQKFEIVDRVDEEHMTLWLKTLHDFHVNEPEKNWVHIGWICDRFVKAKLPAPDGSARKPHPQSRKQRSDTPAARMNRRMGIDV